MSRIYMIRHGRPAASYIADDDPSLDKLGLSQARDAANRLASHVPLELISSPLQRAQQTARPLARLLSQDVSIEPRVAEIPNPGLSLQDRGSWLKEVLYGRWSQQAAELQDWRRQVRECLLSIRQDTAIFTHFVAINAAATLALDEDAVVTFLPDHCSITVFETDGRQLQLIEKGSEASTEVS